MKGIYVIFGCIDLNTQIDDVFESIEREPIGTASLAQCHKATLRDGTVVAVKIQHPAVKKTAASDIRAISVKKILIRFYVIC